jgi:DedD protein
MEKKKILLIAVSVGVFLVIVMGASILVFSPKAGPGPVSVAMADPVQPGKPASADPVDMTRNSEELRDLQSPPASATANQENVFYFLGENPERIVERTDENSETKVVISVPKPSVEAVPEPEPESQPRPRETAPARPPAQAAPRIAPPRPAARTSAAPGAKSAPAPRPAQVYNNYWVQTGSFSTRVRADGVKEVLASKGIPSIIENRDLDGKTFYRVRIGPYTSQNEANYWLSLIKSIGFEDSQVWTSQARR